MIICYFQHLHVLFTSIFVIFSEFIEVLTVPLDGMLQKLNGKLLFNIMRGVKYIMATCQ